MQSVTLEQYFIEDYRRLKAENDQLKSELARFQANAGNHEYGITDLHQRTAAVKGSVISDYYVTSRIEGGYLKPDEVRRLIEMDDAQLFDAVKGKRADYTPILEYEEHEFQYTLMVKESRTEWVAVSDGNRNSNLVDMKESEFCENTWFPAERKDEFKAWLLDILRDELREGLARWEKKKQSEPEGERHAQAMV